MIMASGGVFSLNHSPTFFCSTRCFLSGFKPCGNWIKITRTIKKKITFSGLNILAFSNILFISIIPAPAQKRERGMTGMEKRIVEGLKVEKENKWKRTKDARNNSAAITFCLI